MPTPRSDDRLFARDGFKHFRRSYSLAEVRWGLGVGVVLVVIAGWVWWKGQHPDPDLFAATPQLGSAQADEGEQGEAGRGPLPAGLAAEGWTEGTPSQFDPSNLYVKINGRADYFLSFGFEELTFVPLSAGEEDTAPSVEVEVYDLGTPANALGAFAGERKEGAETEESGGGVSYLSRNALFMARGPYYVRAIGSEESEVVTAQLEHLKSLLEAQLEGADRPWAYELLAGGLGVSADSVSYLPENAFSFAFARDVYSALVEGEVQLFAAVKETEEAAAEMAAQLVEGFAELGETVDGGWVEDRYLGTLAKAEARGRFVLGVRGAPDADAANASMERLREALDGLPPEVREAAKPAPATQGGGGDEGDEAIEDEPVDEYEDEPVEEYEGVIEE